MKGVREKRGVRCKSPLRVGKERRETIESLRGERGGGETQGKKTNWKKAEKGPENLSVQIQRDRWKGGHLISEGNGKRLIRK